jgi:branched-chain amino acid aminotransferase
MLALARAHERGAGEAIFANTRGRLCEGATSNIFLTRRGRTVTPSLASGCLPGITRGLVLELARTNGIPVDETDIPMSALRDAEEAFLTTSLRGVQPVASVDGKKFRKVPGGAARRLARLYQDLVKTHPDP